MAAFADMIHLGSLRRRLAAALNTVPMLLKPRR
jgi:hypothetical protein